MPRIPLITLVFIVSAICAQTVEARQQQGELPKQKSAPRCVETDLIATYKVENDEIVRLTLQDKSQLLMRLKNRCPQLYFHKYLSYKPTDGRLCAGVDEIKTRAGLTCRIDHFKAVITAPPVTVRKSRPNQPID